MLYLRYTLYVNLKYINNYILNCLKYVKDNSNIKKGVYTFLGCRHTRDPDMKKVAGARAAPAENFQGSAEIFFKTSRT